MKKETSLRNSIQVLLAEKNINLDDFKDKMTPYELANLKSLIFMNDESIARDISFSTFSRVLDIIEYDCLLSFKPRNQKEFDTTGDMEQLGDVVTNMLKKAQYDVAMRGNISNTKTDDEENAKVGMAAEAAYADLKSNFIIDMQRPDVIPTVMFVTLKHLFAEHTERNPLDHPIVIQSVKRTLTSTNTQQYAIAFGRVLEAASDELEIVNCINIPSYFKLFDISYIMLKHLMIAFNDNNILNIPIIRQVIAESRKINN